MGLPEGWEEVASANAAAALPHGWEEVDDSGETHLEVVNGLPTYVKGKYKAKPERSLTDKAIGLGEGALTAATGAAAFPLGLVAGPVRAALYGGTADQQIGKTMEDFTYHPRTEAGEENADILGNVAQNLIPVMGTHLPSFSARKINERLQKLTKVEEAAPLPEGWSEVKAPLKEETQGQLFAPDEQGWQPNKYEVNKGEWRTDENGIPVRADKSLDALNVEQPLQKNLWGDELLAQRGEDIPLTEAIDSMAPAERGSAIKSELTGSLEASGALEGAALEATPTRVIPRAQRGAIDLGKPAERIKIEETPDGTGFRAFLDGIEVGYLKDNLPRGMAQKLGENANVDMVHVAPEARSMGVGKALYQAFSDKHDGNIAPSGKTSPSSWKLWQRDFPDKVEGFVRQEAGRLAEGAPLEQVVGNITDAAVRSAVVERANPFRILDTPVPKGQRGGVNLNAIGDAVKKMRNMVEGVAMKGTDRPAMRETPQETMNKVPGLTEATKDWIPDDPTAADIKKSALAEGAEDGKIRLASLRAGAIMAGEQRGSAVIQGVGRTVLNAIKRASRSEREFVQPVEKLIKRMVSTDVKALAQAFKDEMFSGMRFTPEQLSKLGLNGKQIETYSALRGMFDKALEVMNDARLKAGMEPVTPKEAYLSSRWGGSWRTAVYDKSGKLVWYIAENSKRGAEGALKYLAEKHGDIDVSKSTVENRSKNPAYQKNNRGNLEDSYLNMLSVLDKDDPRVQHVRSIMEDAIEQQAYSTLGQAKHFDPKSNVRGFLGDRPWVDATTNAYELFHSQFNYAKSSFKWAELQDAVSKVKETLADKELNELQPNNVEFARQYVKKALGFGESPVVAAIERAIADTIGFDRSIASDKLQLVKGTWLMQKLAGNVGYYASQGLQMLNSIPEHSYLTGRGYKHNMLLTFANANIDFAAAGVSNSSKGLGKEVKVPMTKLGKDAWEYMEQNGISKTNIMDEARGLGQSPIWEGINNLASKPIAWSEQVIRTHTFLQVAHHLDQSGKFTDRSKLFQMAEEATNRSMVDFRKDERASVFEQYGLVGSAASTLKSYLVNYYNNMARYSQEAARGRPRALLAALAVQGTVYGVLNLPGVQEVNDSWEAFKKVLPNSAFQHVKDWNIKQKMIDMQGDWAYGGISVATGVNMASRGNIAIDNSLNPLDSMFPFVGDAYKQSKAVAEGVYKHNETSANQLAYSIAPNGPAQGSIASTESFQSGQRDDGTTVFQKPSKLVDHEFDYARNPDQITKKKWGFTDLEEARTKDLTFSVAKDEMELNKRRKGNVTAAFDALTRHDEEGFDKEVGYYINFNGDPDQFVKEFIQEAMKAKVSREALTAIQSNNIPALKKLQLIKQLVGRIN